MYGVLLMKAARVRKKVPKIRGNSSNSSLMYCEEIRSTYSPVFEAFTRMHSSLNKTASSKKSHARLFANRYVRKGTEILRAILLLQHVLLLCTMPLNQHAITSRQPICCWSQRPYPVRLGYDVGVATCGLRAGSNPVVDAGEIGERLQCGKLGV